MRKPDFYIIGAFKGGSTTLWYYLKQHPDIFMNPLRESRYLSYKNRSIKYKGPGDNKFNNDPVNTLEKYKNLFSGITVENKIGESSSIYFYDSSFPYFINETSPDIKLVISLRDPAERAFTNFIQKKRNREEHLDDFKSSIELEQIRKDNDYSPAWRYTEKGFYYDYLKNFYKIFNREQLKVVLYDDIERKPYEVVKGIFKFLDVDPEFTPNLKANLDETFLVKSRLKHSILQKRWHFYRLLRSMLPNKVRRNMVKTLNRIWENNKLNPKMPPDMRNRLIELYRDDILKTQQLVERDLSAWLR